jgi:alkylhydroperoxidase family enzyme
LGSASVSRRGITVACGVWTLRIPGLDPEDGNLDPAITAALTAQRRRWGVPLKGYLIYARRPSIFKAVRGMWNGLDASGLLDGKLVALVNRRVASLNGCEF